MKIEYIVDNSGVSKGHIKELPDNLAKYLISSKIAVEVKEEKVFKKEFKTEEVLETKENKFTKKTKGNK